MPKYTYKGKNIYGDVTEGVYEAPNEQGVLDMLKSRNFYVLEVKPLIERKDLLDFEANRKIPTKELMNFCKQFSVILRAGIPVLHALSMVESQTESKAMKNVITGIMKDIRMGSSLTQAVKNRDDKLPVLMVYMIEAGEASGTLDRSLDALYLHFEKSYNTQNKVKSAMRYPVIVILVALVVTVFLMIVVVPTFIGIFKDNAMDLPLPTKILIGVSDFFVKYGVITLLALVGLFLIFKLYSYTPAGALNVDRIKMRLPVFSKMTKRNISARFARTMSTLLASGVGITESLDITSRVLGNRYAEEQLQEVRRQVIAGRGIYGPLKDTACFPEMMENMIMMGEEAGNIEGMLANAAGIFEEEIDTSTQKMTDMIQPFIIIFLGGMVGFIILAVAMPLFSLY
ncbi:MAG: type II secretion system F family protein [Lachnospiraceae bacterium]|nr:type II secretion system F family protein [Lachnospiraceae bacterium]